MQLMDEERQLIPGLPEDIALNCIARVPHRFHPHLQRVCRRWRDLFTAPFFCRSRERIGSAEDLVFLVQAVIGPTAAAGDAEESAKHREAAGLRPPICALSVYSASDGSWNRFASPDPIPLFAECAAVDGRIVIVGGWDFVTLDPVTEVRVLDLVTREWSMGRPMAAARS